jgi:addiction module RelE/StbE family toxin
MAGRVRWTENAGRDLESIADYVYQDSPHYAATLVQKIRTAARSLNEMPERGRVVPELGDPRIRELLVGNYRLIYQLADESVILLAVIHGARDLKALWKEEGRPDERPD